MGIRLVWKVLAIVVALFAFVLTPSSAAESEWVEKAQLPGATDFAVNGTNLIIGSPSSSDEAGVAYVYKYDGGMWIEEARIDGSSFGGGPSFGQSVAIHGSTAVVGAPDDDHAGDGAGAVYLFHFDGDSWKRQGRLVASDAASGDNFGETVGLSGSVLAISAPGGNAAHIFQARRGRWVEQATLTGDGAYWESLVTSSSTVAVLARNSTGKMTSILAFESSNGRWEQTAVLISPEPVNHEYFTSLAISGDTIVAGSNVSSVQEIPGAAFVYTRQRGQWRLNTSLASPDELGLDFFGESLAIDGDTIVIAAPGDFCCTGTYAFTARNGKWTFDTTVPASSLFGGHMSLDGDVLAIGIWGTSGAATAVLHR